MDKDLLVSNETVSKRSQHDAKHPPSSVLEQSQNGAHPPSSVLEQSQDDAKHSTNTSW